MTPIILFNCCTDNAEPDWSRFTQLELGGCINESQDSETTHINGGQHFADAEFFSIYGRTHDGEAEAITDCQTALDVLCVAEALRELSARAGHMLNVVIYP